MIASYTSKIAARDSVVVASDRCASVPAFEPVRLRSIAQSLKTEAVLPGCDTIGELACQYMQQKQRSNTVGGMLFAGLPTANWSPVCSYMHVLAKTVSY